MIVNAVSVRKLALGWGAIIAADLLVGCGARTDLASSTDGFDLAHQGSAASDAAAEAHGDALLEQGPNEDVVEPTWEGGAELCPITPAPVRTPCPGKFDSEGYTCVYTSAGDLPAPPILVTGCIESEWEWVSDGNETTSTDPGVNCNLVPCGPPDTGRSVECIIDGGARCCFCGDDGELDRCGHCP
jgi:hypothetical protein